MDFSEPWLNAMEKTQNTYKCCDCFFSIICKAIVLCAHLKFILLFDTATYLPKFGDGVDFGTEASMEHSADMRNRITSRCFYDERYILIRKINIDAELMSRRESEGRLKHSSLYYVVWMNFIYWKKKRYVSNRRYVIWSH